MADDAADSRSLNETPGPPEFPEIERLLLGAIQLKPALFEYVAEALEPDHYVEEAHGRIWEVFQAVWRRGDPLGSASYLEPCVEELGWPRADTLRFMVGMMKDVAVPNRTNVEYWAAKIKDVWQRREVWFLAQDMIRRTRGGLDNDAAKIIEETESKLYGISVEGTAAEERSFTFAQASDDALDQAHAAADRYSSGQLVGVPTGLTVIDNKLGGVRNTDLIIIGSRPGMGKAQPLDSQVLLSNGRFVPMGSLKVGDRLASVDGEPSRVRAIYPQGTKAVYRITFKDGRSTEACAEHLWRVRHRQWKFARTVSTADLMEMMRVARNIGRLWIDQVSGEFGHGAELPIHPWLLGVLLGDGSFKNGTPRLSSADPEIVNRVADLLGTAFKLTPSGKYDYRITQAKRRGPASNPLNVQLKALGLAGLGSHEKQIPAIYLTANIEARLELLRGLMDTDGWAERHGSVRFISTSAALAVGVQAVVRSLGGLCEIVEKRPHFTHKGVKKAGRVAYQCNIRHEFPARFFFLERKSALARNQHAPRLNLVSVTLSRTAPTQCIRVSHRSRTYVTDQYIVTHNTALSAGFANAAAQHFLAQAPERPQWVIKFSLEMSADQLALRRLCAHARVSFEKVRLGHADARDLMALDQARKDLQGIPFRIDDTAQISVSAMRTRVRRHARRHGPVGLVMIDYLQLIGLSREERKEAGGNRVQEISTITRNLKAMAKDLQLPILCLAQLNRDLEKREDKRPMLSDLRESGTIEQDADIVAFLYREHYYASQRPPPKKERETKLDHDQRVVEWRVACEACEDHAELIIAKNRHGSLGTLPLKFERTLMLFPDDTPGGAGGEAQAERARQFVMDVENRIT